MHRGLFTFESFVLHYVRFLLAAATSILSFLVPGLALRRVPAWRRSGAGCSWAVR